MPTRTVVAGVVGGLLVGVLLCGVVVATGWLDRPTPVRGDDAIAAFLEAWRGNREGTFVVESTFERTTASGDQLESAVRVAQRPPDRVVVQFDSVDASVDGRPLRCVEGGALEGDVVPGELYCAPATEGPDYEEQTAEELDVWLGYLVGEPPLYAVEGDGEGCFDLDLVRDLPYAPYGDHARFCFDEPTGAMTLARIERREATDVTEAVSVRGEVTDADLELPVAGG
jgi:hypothetical protein